jgi:predicted enzyme related to lactoylglutathione lyase
LWTSRKQLFKEYEEMANIPKKGFNWHELMTTDTKGAANFYREVTGLTVIPGDYQMLMAGDQPVGGLVGPRPEGPIWPSGGPQPHWIAYLGVEDVDAAVRKARELKGQVLVPPTEIPEFGRVAVLRDPQGAAFGIYSPKT